MKGHVVTPIGNAERIYTLALRSAKVDTYSVGEMKELLDSRPNPRVSVELSMLEHTPPRRHVIMLWEDRDLVGSDRTGVVLLKIMSGGRIRFQDNWLSGTIDGLPALLPSIEVLGADFLESPPPLFGAILADALGREPIMINAPSVRDAFTNTSVNLEFLREFFGTPDACATEQQLQQAMEAVLNDLFHATPD